MSPPPLLRLSQAQLDAIRADLERPHPFAGERVGYLQTRKAHGHSPLLLACGYLPVPDEGYVDDPTVGARVGPSVIRAMLQRALSTGDGLLHVHMHPHFGPPELSRTDLHSLRGLLPAFQGVTPQACHGALLLSMDWGAAWVWEASTLVPTRVVGVGYPLLRWEIA